MGKVLNFTILAAVLLAMLLGASMCGNLRETVQQLDWATGTQRAERERIENAARAEQLRIKTAQERKLAEVNTAAGIVLRLIGVGLLGVLGVVGVYAAWQGAALSFETWRRWANTFYPNDAGIFPLVKLRISGQWVVHDANKAIAASTIYAPGAMADSIAVIPVLPSGDMTPLSLAQVEGAARAQGVQAIAAANRPLAAKRDSAARQVLTPAAEVLDLLPEKITLAELLQGQTPSLQSLVLGAMVDERGVLQPVRGGMTELVHIGVGGTSRWGKSAFLRMLAYQLALAREALALVLIDLEGVTFSAFTRCERLLFPIADSETSALAVLQELLAEMDRRKGLFKQYPGVDSLTAYNAQAAEPLRAVIALIDEATALLGDKDVQGALRTLVLRARKYGLWIVAGGQDWKATSIDTAIRHQLSTRIQFKAMSPSQSKVLLEQRGAEELTIPGRALALIPGAAEIIQMQAPWVEPHKISQQWARGAGAQQPLPALSYPERAEAARIQALAAQGLSKREIQRQIFGYAGGAAYEAVARALG